MAAELTSTAARRLRLLRPLRLRAFPHHLLVAAAAVFAVAAVVLMAEAVRSGRQQLQLRLSVMADLAALPWSSDAAAAAEAAGAAEAGTSFAADRQPAGDPPDPSQGSAGQPAGEQQAADGDRLDASPAAPAAQAGSSSSSSASEQPAGSSDSSSGSSILSELPADEPPVPAAEAPAAAAAGTAPAAAAAAAAGTAAGQPAAAQEAASEPADLTCSEALEAPRIALLFLTTRRLAHERLWRLWLWDAAHLVPRQALPAVQEGLCSADAGAADAAWQRLRQACPLAPSEVTAAGVTTQLPPQHLFSIYVHAPPDYQGLEYQPLFVGRVILERLRTWWGDFSIVDAERALLRAALADPRNRRFVLISDSDVPLYDPLTFYQQLLSETRSRVRACAQGYNGMNHDRWRDEMATARMQRQHWRKSNQFFGLTRAHAELVAGDVEVFTSFRNKCGGWYPHLNRWQTCVADEHYIPTLLAAMGLENETYCAGWGLAYTDWSGGGMHPRSFKPRDVTPALVKKMRWGCKHMAEAVEDSQHMFVPLEPLLEAASAQQACQRLQEAAAGGFGSNSSGSSPPAAVRGYDRPLDGSCPLTARKFPAYTALRVRQLFATSCPGGAPALAESKAAQLFRVERDPSVVLLRGRACAPDVQRAVMLRSAAGGATRRAARRLLCAASAWLALDPLEAACADV